MASGGLSGALNKVTIFDRYAIPKTQDFIPSSGCYVFSSIDLQADPRRGERGSVDWGQEKATIPLARFLFSDDAKIAGGETFDDIRSDLD